MADSNYTNDNTSDQNAYGGDNQNSNDSYGSNQDGGSLYNNTSSSTESASSSFDSNSGSEGPSSQYGGSSQNGDSSQSGSSSLYGDSSQSGDQNQSTGNSSSAYGDSSQSGSSSLYGDSSQTSDSTLSAKNSSSSFADSSSSGKISDSNSLGSGIYGAGSTDSQEKPAENASSGSALGDDAQKLDGKEVKNDLMNVKSEVGKEEKAVTSSEPVEMGEALPLAFGAVCILFFLLIQNFAQACRRYCQTDSSLSNSIISGASLGYLLLKGFPFLFNLVYAASPQIKNLYLKQHGHLLLVALMAFGLGFIFNYFFEKKIARNTVEDVAHSKTLYRLNLGVLATAFFFAGLTVLNVTHLHYVDIFQYGLFIGLMLCIETATLCYVFTDRNDWIRRGLLSVSVILGFLIGKFSAGMLAPSVFSIGFGFVLGFFVFTTIRVELATVKRNSNYSAFIVSFMSIAALTLIQSLYESLKC